jgi:MATE family multidrug resistance protein
MFFHQSRLIVAHAWPMLIAQLASMGMMVIDTVLLGHFGTEDLAAVAVGSGIYVAVIQYGGCGIWTIRRTKKRPEKPGNTGETAKGPKI